MLDYYYLKTPIKKVYLCYYVVPLIINIYNNIINVFIINGSTYLQITQSSNVWLIVSKM